MEYEPAFPALKQPLQIQPGAALVSCRAAHKPGRNSKGETNMPMEKTAKIYVAGHRGMVGGAILRALQ